MTSSDSISDFIVLDSISEEDSDVICDEQITSSNNSQKGCDCNIKIEKLQSQINQLQKKLNVEKASNTKVSKAPVQIYFLDENLSKKYGKKVESFLQNLISSSDLSSSKNYNTPAEKRPKPIEVFNGFCIDTQDENRSSQFNSPLYQPSTHEGLNGTKPSDSGMFKNMGTCFNCQGDHIIKDCPVPLDRSRIAKNRANHSTKSVVSSSRYHLAGSNLNRFHPGAISQTLQDALDVDSNEIPEFIYRMRVLGYPPGWLRHAEVEESNIKLYQSHEENESDRDSEDSCQPVRYDTEKIVSYPGFNQRPERNLRDHGEQKGYPCIQNHHLKENMIKTFISSAKGHSNHKRKVEYDDKDCKRRKVEEANQEEMEIVVDDISSPVREVKFSSPENKSPRKKNESLGKDKNRSSTDSPKCPSPTLSDLENARSSLLNELFDDDTVESVDNDAIQEDLNRSSYAINSEVGSPSVATVSGVKKLPSWKKFAEQIGEHLPFENLHDSTGSYNKMKKILSVVRNKTNKSF